MKLIYEFTEGLDCPVSICHCPNDTYVVMYGAEKYDCYDYSHAAKQLGVCLMHSLQCAGEFPEDYEYLD